MTRSTLQLLVASLLVVMPVVPGCNEARDRPEPAVVFADIEPLLQEHCVGCHGGPLAAADYRVEDYLETIRCVPDGQPATLPPEPAAPIIAVLDQPDHVDLLAEDETQGLTNWVTEGAFPANKSTHPGQWIDPRAEDWHGAYLAQTDWQPIVDPERSDACGLCHRGSPPLDEVVIKPPPGATDCTDCHALAGGVMACGTCHGDELRPYPPRDQCYFPGPPFGGAHETHTTSSDNMFRPLDCQACHFGDDYSSLDGRHGNGEVDVVFQPAWGPDANYDFDTLRCATTCHTRGGTTPVVAWDEQLELGCESCHETPPLGHSSASCNGCHLGINAEGTHLMPEAPHINGRIDAF